MPLFTTAYGLLLCLFNFQNKACANFGYIQLLHHSVLCLKGNTVAWIEFFYLVFHKVVHRFCKLVIVFKQMETADYSVYLFFTCACEVSC